MHADYRYDPFTDASTAAAIANEARQIPASSPYTLRLNEVPLKETPSTLSVRVRDHLTAAISSAGATSCTVINGAWFAINDVITVGSEQMLVTNVVSNTLTITRGYNSTTATTHLAGAIVYGPAWAEVAATPAARQYWPDYGTGADNDDLWNTGTLQFNSADANKVLDISYNGTGTLAGVNPALATPMTFADFGDGSDGHFISSGSDTIDGLKQYKSFIILPGHTVTVGTNPLHLLCQGAVVIHGTLNGAGANGNTRNSTSDGTVLGGIGRGGGGDGGSNTVSGSGTTSNSTPGIGRSGAAGGAGGGANAGAGGVGVIFGQLITNTVSAILAKIVARLLHPSAGAGGGGGNGAGGGGGGGGSIVLVAKKLIAAGTLTLTAGAAGAAIGSVNAGGGGGGGASIRIIAPTIRNLGTISVAGGAGGAGSTAGNAGNAGWSLTFEIGG